MQQQASWTITRVSEPSDRVEERNGRFATPRPPGLLVSVHAANEREASDITWITPKLAEAMGESVALVTTLSVGDGDEFSVPAPFDTNSAVTGFLEHWRPDVGVIVGGDYRPALLATAARRGVPLISINAHVREDGAPVRVQEAVVESCTKHFKTTLDQDGSIQSAIENNALRSTIQRSPAIVEGYAVPPANETDREALSSLLATRPVWCAIGVSRAEIEPLAIAHAHASKHTHRALLIVQPAQLEITDQLQHTMQRRSWSVARRSLGEEPEVDTQVYITDTQGEEGLWHRLASVSFLGNSLAAPGGGVSPFPAAALGSVVLHGPHVSNHADRYDRLARAGAARLVLTGEGLGSEVRRYFQPDLAATAAQAAWSEISIGAEEADRFVETMCSFLEAVEAT